MLIVDKHCSDVYSDEFSVPQIDRKSKQVKGSDMEKFICNQYPERHAILNTRNTKICGWITKLEAIKNKMQFDCVFFHIYRKKNYFPRYRSNMPKVRRVI